jgi:hypothetical protein
MNTDMDLFELVLFEAVLSLIYICFLLTAVFFTGQNLFLILLSMSFGLLTVPFSNTSGSWWTFLKYQEREKLKTHPGERKWIISWLCLDFGLKGNCRFFGIISVITAGFAVYHLVMYWLG